jgi:putative DNA primase/helicase
MNAISIESNLQRILKVLHARTSGAGWAARCPAHDDLNPSLSIAFRDGRVLLHCHAGCTQESVIDALCDRGLWRPNAMETGYPTDWGELINTYDYVDEQGCLLYQVCRFVPKTFRPRRPDGQGKWRWGYGDVRRVLYRLPEVLEAPIVFVVEGERDVETLRKHGFAATTNAGGANARWEPEYTKALAGREVILIPDNDAPGRKRVLNIARALLGQVSRLIVLELDGGPKDITEWFSQGHSELELIAQLDGEAVSQ